MSKTTQFSPYKPVEMFDSFIPEALQLDIAKGVVREYHHAKIFCDTEFNPAESRDLLPHYRRACIESMLCELSNKYSGMRNNRKQNLKRNCSHRLIFYRRIMLTQSLVERERMLPREAIYRESYARDPQLHLFGKEEPTIEDAPLYGIITHAPVSGRENDVPSFVDIVFPDKRYKMIVDRIPLLIRFPRVLEEDEMTVQENIPDSLEAKLRLRKEQA